MSLRAVVDTNILISGVIRPQGRVGPVLLHLRQGTYTLLYNQALLAELVGVLTRPRFGDKYGITARDVATIVRLILLRGDAVTVTTRIVACRDAKDDKFLEVAVAGHADFLVSGDEDLLVLHPFRGIPIISPATFLALLDESNQQAE